MWSRSRRAAVDYLTLVSDYSFKVVHEVTKGYPIFQTEVPDPYPHLNGAQQLGALEACPTQTVTFIATFVNQFCCSRNFETCMSVQSTKQGKEVPPTSGLSI